MSAPDNDERTQNNNPSSTNLTEDEKADLRNETNSRVSHWCAWAALIIVLVSCASYILGHFDLFFIRLGIMVSIALLALALIKNPSR